MLYWGREDPVIAGASGVEFQRLARRWEGDRAGVPGFRSYMGGGGKSGKGKGTRRESGSETEDNVSSLGTIGPTTIGSGGTVTGVSVTQQRRMSASGRSMQSATSPKQAVPAVPKEGGDSGNESSGENSDGVVSAASSVGGDSGGRKQQKQKKRVSVETRLVDWSDDEDNTSELEWAGWQMDLQRQAKRQYAIQARRDVESMWESDEELADLGLPANPIDDMKKYIKNRYQLEPEARIILGARSRGKLRLCEQLYWDLGYSNFRNGCSNDVIGIDSNKQYIRIANSFFTPRQSDEFRYSRFSAHWHSISQ
jgi:hypothetical protein